MLLTNGKRSRNYLTKLTRCRTRPGVIQRSIDRILTIFLWLLYFVMFYSVARGADIQHRYAPTIGPSGYVNPKQFNFGTLTTVPFIVHPTDSKTWTVIQLRPFGTPLLYSENILFCGDVRKYFQDTEGKFVLLVYSRASSEIARDKKLPIVDTCRAFDSIVIIQPETEYKENQ